MTKLKIMIVEDELIVSEEIKEILLHNDYDVIGQADSSDEALQIISKQVPDMILMDINIKGALDGIQLAKKIIELHDPIIIFLTAFHDKNFIERAKDVKPSAYLVKPYDTKNLLAAIEIAINNQSTDRIMEIDTYKVNDAIFIKDQSRFVKIFIADILFIEAIGSYIDIQTTKGKYTLAINLKTFEERLSHERFMRVHRSFLVNLDKIEIVTGNSIQIDNKSIPISEPNRDDFMNRYRFI